MGERTSLACHAVPRSCTILVLGAMGVAMAASPARAIVTELKAELRSNVQSFLDEVEDSSDEAIEQFGDTPGLQPPLQTLANVEHADQADEPRGRGVAVADFRDPTQTTATRNPEDIGLEADCFSLDTGLRYEMDSGVVETRVVQLPAAELQGIATVQSVVFVSGAIFAYSLDADRDLSGVVGELSLVVRRLESEDAEEGTVVLNEAVEIRGMPDGTLVTSNSDGLFVVAGALDILPDAATSMLPLDIDLDALAVAEVAIVPEQTLAYEYAAVAQQPFVLQAEFTLSVANVPDGTGVAAVFGRGFDIAADIIEIGIPAESARVLQARLNEAIDRFQAPGRPAVRSPLAGACGAFGPEVLALMALTAVSCRFMRTRYRR